MIGIQVQGLLAAQKILAYVAPKLTWIIRIDGGSESGFQYLLKIMFFQSIEDA